MIGLKRITAAALLVLGATGSLGCELISNVDRSKIPGLGGSGTGGGTGGTGAGVACGDGVVSEGEDCDDGNTISGDGCDPDCKVENGYTCTGEPSACSTSCGDGVVAGDEKCDDGNTKAGDGCDASCKVETGYTCTGMPSTCTATCGDGIKAGTEECDDGNTTTSDGCDASCAVEPGWSCAGTPSVCTPGCGDAVVAGSEGCDDGNLISGDGCDHACQTEPGFTCTGSPSICATSCGDGIVAGAEQCDDGNNTDGDGCDASCHPEPGYTCTGSPSTCTTTCGDGIQAATEACDDGNTTPGDGCDAGCKIETGFTCSGMPSKCATTCGDGIIAGTETCDDSNAKPGDGCDGSCKTELGWTCTGAPSSCHTTCGDGIKAGTEECDDANAVNLDGCNTACKVDVFNESEPNDTVAQANGPFDHGVLVHGSAKPGNDPDFFAIQLPATADLHIETFDQSGQGSCANIDTVVTFYDTNGTTVLASDDDSGINRCSKLDSATTAGVRHLPAGTYYVKVESYALYAPIPGYSLVVTFNALCGDGKKQGAEQCDGTAGCAPTCDRVPSCGDGFIDGTEQCDDGNTMNGDGCSSTCQYEILGETEPNNTSAQANGPYHPNVLLSGSINPATDADVFAITLPATADLRLETFDASGPSSCNAIDTVITLYGTDGTTQLIQRDQGGVNNCSRIDPSLAGDKAAAHLLAGTYYVKVESHANAFTIPGYKLLATFAALCGNGVVEGSEACDGGPGCTATCDRVPVCGDGFVDGTEQCDDGNTVSGDGCSATCQLELVSETEPNDTPAQANGPYSSHTIIAAALSPANDADYFEVQVTAVSDLRIETFDGNGPGSCVNLDTVATLFDTDGTTVLATEDDGGIGTCSKIDPKVDTGARHLAPGTYYVKVANFLSSNVSPAYRLEITFTAVCGDGKVQGAEECDGTPNCDASCNRVPTCGDGFIDAPETCDDGNTTNGDGCSATCTVEGVAEIEPNGTTAEADASGVLLTGTATVSGAIGAVGDKDLYKLVLASASVVRFETLDGSGADCSIATTLRLLDGTGTQLYTDDNSGISSCSALVLGLAAGTYYVGVEQQGNTAAIPAYLLQVSVEADGGAESEPNDTRAQASMVSGGDVFVLGGHQQNGDVDFFAITVPPGKSVRAEVIEGSGAETCESLDIDSLLTLYDAAGVAIESDDDGGRGFCSRIDGTGADPVNPGAGKLAGGTYYLAVEAAPFAQGPSDTSGQFDYRLVVTIR